ncbi:LLM class flavin-dependent oxidoreductase [Actinoplanes sp. NPDC026623]|uniref:LLM class flavin-dependent oxidoreductase n=1 Tax=Actinoplanes sp. NPDC026623 TaxID=3155610 RepID=UPI0033EC4534
MTKLGAVFLPSNPPERLRDIACAADDAGLEQLWLWEDCFLNGGVSAASAALAWTTRLKVGIGIVPVPFRNVALAAMEIATMRRMFGDRAIVGIGHGVQEWMAQVGVKAASPMTLLREHTTALRALLHGETVTVQGRYVKLDAVALDWAPDPAPELLIGATGPRTLRLSGELADGTILTGGTPPAGVVAAREHIGAGEGHEVVVFLPAASGPGAAQRLATWQEREGVDFPGVAGDAKAVAATIERFVEAGATTVILQPTADDPDPEGFLRFVAEEVRPLID